MHNDVIIKNDVDPKEEDPLERAMRELQMLKDLVSRSPVHFTVYDAADRLIAWNRKYEENHPEAFELHRAEANAGTLTYRQLLKYQVAKTTPPNDREAELERLVAAQRGCDGTPVDRYYHSVGHLRVYKYPLSSGAVAGLAMDINDMVNARVQLSKAREESNLRYDQLNELVLARSSASKERAQAEERYRSLVDHAPDGITIVDLDTVTFAEEANPRFEALFGLSRNELLGKLGPKDVSPEFQPDGRSSAEAAMAYLNAAFVEGPQRFEWLGRTADGRDFPCQISCIRFPHPTRRMVRASVVDLTQQTHAEQARLDLEQKLARSHRLELVGQMTGGVAHDFNNVLSILLGNLELLDEKAADPETRSVIKSAMEATEHGARLTRAMLNYSRQAPLHPETFKVSDVVRRMENLISRTIPSRISIETDFEDESWAIAADVSNTESAILNLVLNSYDATPNNGLIKIRTASVEVEGETYPEVLQPGCYTVLTIQDSGEGIPDDVLEKIFEPFFTTKGVGQNSGLGLSMVQGFMSQSGGCLHVESQVGVGTVIKLYFPAVFESVPDQTETTSTNVESVQGFTGCIMLVEDNPGVSELMETRLKQQGHEVLTANSADSAIEVFENAMHVDLLISDIAIPGSMQGPQLAQYFKKFQPDLPVIFISGYSFGLEAKEAGLLESDVLLTKPVRQGEFIAAVSQMLASSLTENSQL